MIESPRDGWVARWVKPLTLDLSSGHDLMVCEFEPHIGLHAEEQSLLGILSLPLSLAPLPLALCVSLSKINK